MRRRGKDDNNQATHRTIINHADDDNYNDNESVGAQITK